MDEISFASGRDRCAAWHFDANGDAFAGAGGVPCVVMAPGFAGTRDTNALMDYARGFAAAGLAVVLFDYRGFGGSDGSRASSCRHHANAGITAPRLPLPGGCRASTRNALCCGASRTPAVTWCASPPRTDASRRWSR